MDYRGWALLSALFAGITAVLAKRAVGDVSSNLALAIRVLFVVVFAWGIVFVRKEAHPVDWRTVGLLGLSGLGTGASWLCYFRALEKGEVAKVAPIDKLSFVIAMLLGVAMLGERPSKNVWLGAAFIVVGVMITLK